MKHIITIFKNLGTIVILLFQIGYVSIVDYIRPYDKPKPKQSDIKNKTTTSNNEPLRDVCWDSSEYSIEDENIEVVHERPHYK